MDSSAKAEPQSPSSSSSPPSAAIQAAAVDRPSDAPRRCFICLTDEDPSDPPGSWVDPCPCTLEAHQDCMLSWVTDCERSNKPLKCPVCKSAIEMDGPWDPIASLHDAIQQRFTRASPFILLTGVSVGVQFSLQMYGAMALWTFAGKEALLRFALGPDMVIDGRPPGALRFAKERIVNALILTNVAPTLLVSQLLPGLTNRYFMQSASIYGIYSMIRNENFLEWPPSPRMAMVALPILRKMYFSFWRDFIMPYEVKLNRQISGLPPLDPQQEADGAHRQDLERNGEGGFIGLLQNILDVLDPDEEEPAAGANNGGREARGGAQHEIRLEQREEGDEIRVELLIEEVVEDGDDEVQVVVPEDEEFGGQRWGQAQDELANGHAQENQREAPQAPPARRMGLGGLLSSVSNSIVGALLLPGISFAMGEALRLMLPRSWTTAPPKNNWLFGPSPSGRPGLLQQQWGRSLVGGCLYVVLNDVIRVYSKSRKVAAMQNRKVKNVDRPRRRK
ncbi:uncharacterized protein TRIREDRAFT_119792 [Trichoderma reesei QM6a]|uniref:Predicted protein n=2 Tax=Hypocrea jecorina TaxID=51453 RepID=G0R8M8_HYPJQ|nr:uncharacterized protein TRIREDRAFT_119792 [Trichoderma reesei QM6a]EGR52910.1 predicted protein [Trichoderma reesei QM6a]ETS06734.1 hypothetical protein M419DRAFT_68251 [Trichoderma reesei RUT C-30]